VAIAGDVGCQQLGVTALALNAAPISHGRTVTNRWWCGTSPNRDRWSSQEAA
jgi:hypothetical protein